MKKNTSLSSLLSITFFIYLNVSPILNAETVPVGEKPYQIIKLDKIYDFSKMDYPFSAEEAERFASVCDMETRNALIDILRDEKSDKDYNKNMMCFFLGRTHDENAYISLVSYLERQFKVSINEDVRCAIWDAMAGLGYLGTKNSIDYLAKMASASYWNETPSFIIDSTCLYKTRKEFLIWIRQGAIAMLGLSGHELATQALEKMESDPDFLEVKEIVSSAKECNLKHMKNNQIKRNISAK